MNRSSSFLFCILLLSVCAPAWTQPISVNQSEAEISFYFIDDEVDGTMGGFEFTGDIDLSNLPGSAFSGAVATRTLDTNNWLRSRHLRARKYFNAKDHPKLIFESTSVSGVKEGFQVIGTLEIKGIEREVNWVFTNNGTALTGTTQVNTQDYNISIHTKRERNEVKITVRLPYSL
ncbi:MAG: YceI family protein [Bacteroidota bacterium]